MPAAKLSDSRRPGKPTVRRPPPDFNSVSFAPTVLVAFEANRRRQESGRSDGAADCRDVGLAAQERGPADPPGRACS